MPSVVYAPLPNRSLIALEGLEAIPFLQALVTQDLAPLTPEKALYTLLLSPQGRFLCDFFVLQNREGLLLDVHKGYLTDLVIALKRYCLRQNVSFKDVSAAYRVFCVFGENACKMLNLPEVPGYCVRTESISFVDPRLESLGIRVILKAGDSFRLSGAVPGSLSDYRQLNMELGVPGQDALEPNKSIPLEYGLHTLGAISQDKGCYIGQELIARTLHRGQVRKHIFPGTVQGEMPHLGDLIYTKAGERVGRIVDVYQDRALMLAYINALLVSCEARDVLEVRRATDRVCTLRPYAPSWMNLV